MPHLMKPRPLFPWFPCSFCRFQKAEASLNVLIEKGQNFSFNRTSSFPEEPTSASDWTMRRREGSRSCDPETMETVNPAEPVGGSVLPQVRQEGGGGGVVLRGGVKMEMIV